MKGRICTWVIVSFICYFKVKCLDYLISETCCYTTQLPYPNPLCPDCKDFHSLQYENAAKYNQSVTLDD